MCTSMDAEIWPDADEPVMDLAMEELEGINGLLRLGPTLAPMGCC